MATDTSPNTLLESAKCYDCNGSWGTWSVFEMGLWKTYLLKVNPVADTSVNSILEAAKCYECLSPGEWELIKLGLLQKILLAANPGANTSANGLIEAAKCYDCYGGGGMWQLMELGLIKTLIG